MINRVILLEFNELCPLLIERFIAAGALPNFKRLRNAAQVFTTVASDDHVQPWVQWVTFHLGLPQAVHKIDNLDEGHLIDRPALWDDLARRGLTSFVFGTMNTGPSRDQRVVLMPDPWSAKVEASTPDLAELHAFLCRAVQEHANPFGKKSTKEIAAFAALLFRLGLSASTIMAGIFQLVREKVSPNDERWRRACVLDRILWDVFESQVRQRRDHLSIFFANSTAHFQHRYWRHMDPDAYGVRPSEQDLANYGGAIEFGYRQMDRLVGRTFRLADQHTAIVLATGLSQHVNEAVRHTAGQVAYRPVDFNAFLGWCGVTGYRDIAPLMSTTACVDFSTPDDAKAAAEKLATVTLAGRPIINSWMQGSRLYFMCDLTERVADEAVLSCRASNETRRFHSFYAAIGTTLLDACHAREGVFWIHDPHQEPRVHAEQLPLENAKALLLNLYGLQSAVAAE